MDSVNVLSSELRGTFRKEVPSIKGAWVEFFDDITMDVISKAQDSIKSGTPDITANLDIVANQIAFWNFADQDGKILPVNVDSLKKLPMKLIMWISTTQQEILQYRLMVEADEETP